MTHFTELRVALHTSHSFLSMGIGKPIISPLRLFGASEFLPRRKFPAKRRLSTWSSDINELARSLRSARKLTYKKRTQKQNVRYLGIARGSNHELLAQVLILSDLKIIEADAAIIDRINYVGKMLTKLIQCLK